MMNRKCIVCIVKIVVFLCILSIIIYCTGMVFREKTNIHKNRDFFLQKEDFDVLFFGSSHMEIYVNPMDLWEDFGIVSYNFGNPEESIETSYWLMKNAISVHKPKVIVFDVAMFNLCENNTNKDHLHYALDSFPISRYKLEAINEALQDSNEKIEMFFTLGSYHSRWKELDEGDFTNLEHYVKGNMSYGYWHTTKVTPTEQYPLVNGERENSEKDQEALYKIISMCKQEGIELLFVANPYCSQDYKQQSIHSVQAIAEKENVDFINFIDEDFVTDYKVDYYDDDHVNQSGMHKVTYCLGDYISKKYDVRDYRNDSRYDSWMKDYENYKQLKLEALGQMADDINTFLELLHDSDYETTVFIGKDFEYAVDNELVNDLLQNIGRENLIIKDKDEFKSSDIYPLNMLENCVGNDNYIFTVCSGRVEKEQSGLDAVKNINDVCEGKAMISTDEMVVCVSEVGNRVPRIVRKYSSDGISHEDLVYNIENILSTW